MIEHPLPALFAAALGALCLVGAIMDIRSRRLPNWLCAITALVGLSSVYFLTSQNDVLMAAIHGLIALVAGMVLFQFGMIGGGDAKFYAAIACWFPVSKGVGLLGLTSFFTLLFVLVWLGLSFRRSDSDKQRSGKKSMLPFGVPIAAAGLIGFWFSNLT